MVAAIVAVVVMRGWVFGGCLLLKWDEGKAGEFSFIVIQS